MRVLLAPDKFKGCLTAAEVAAALTAGIHDRRPQVEVVQVPVADGGDGTVAAALSAGFTFVDVVTVGPTGAPVETGYAVRGEQAVVELADVVGLSRLPRRRRDPMAASTFGLGVVVRDAIDRGARKIVLGLGGSASTDGGAGLVQALGAVLTDGAGRDLSPGGAALFSLDSLDLTALKERIDGVTFVVACDVDNPLLGPDGAAAVFGPQKGADVAQVRLLESALAVWSGVVARTTGVDLATHAGAGAAGGTGFAALALLDATLRPGIDLVLDLVGFEELMHGCDLVITGEGSLDAQSLAGKAPVGVAQAAGRATPGVLVLAVAGRVTVNARQLHDAGIARAYALSDLEPDVSISIAHAPALLRTVGATIAEEWLSATT